MLFVHEEHEVRGRREKEFEAAVRDEWRPALARDDDARLLYFLHHAHGSGPSYRVVTITAVKDGAAWERLVRRIDGGDLRDAVRRLDELRYDAHAKVLVPLPWSKLQQVRFGDLPGALAEREPTLFMEDTVWPDAGKLEDYVERSGSHYAREMRERGEILTVEASFRTAYGAGRRREVILWQKVVRADFLVPLLTREVPDRFREPGTWMHDALELRDQWRSRLLRTVPWSPLT
ncbi:MAG TPA: hypothetical protein VFB01_18695 [Burkholderiales bacterium]|nr:hypothetical protein [Burkholderiales bacterium]